MKKYIKIENISLPTGALDYRGLDLNNIEPFTQVYLPKVEGNEDFYCIFNGELVRVETKEEIVKVPVQIDVLNEETGEYEKADGLADELQTVEVKVPLEDVIEITEEEYSGAIAERQSIIDNQPKPLDVPSEIEQLKLKQAETEAIVSQLILGGIV